MNKRDFYKSLWFLLGKFFFEHVPVNVATWGTADLSILYHDWYAQNALDGSIYTCSSTPWQTDPWWKLDLMKTYSVNRVTITSKPDCTSCESWLNGAEIRIGNVSLNVSSNPICAVVSTIPTGATYSYSCHGMEGRYIIVNNPGTSKCVTPCEVGVYVIFPGNLATERTVTQSSTNGSWITEQAIDFNPGIIKQSSGCSSTNVQTNPWWRVDLSYIYRVSRVVITNRLDCCPERINGAEIRIGNSLENNEICSFQLQSALVQRGFSDVTLQWSQPPKQEVMRKEAAPAQCAVRKR
uniref:Fucolectin tachylectin-4 pentraxin-1 domain-containing protein n=1 Tax=Cyprinus carpio TaxID=7962 RepID=A0A8C1S277_CYPCA